MQRSELPPLPCPECVERAGTSTSEHIYRIGNEKTRCHTCNRYWQAVLRLTGRKLRIEQPKLYAKYRMQAEAECYKKILEEYTARGVR